MIIQPNLNVPCTMMDNGGASHFQLEEEEEDPAGAAGPAPYSGCM
jgi:hypothetical protein